MKLRQALNLFPTNKLEEKLTETVNRLWGKYLHEPEKGSLKNFAAIFKDCALKFRCYKDSDRLFSNKVRSIFCETLILSASRKSKTIEKNNEALRLSKQFASTRGTKINKHFGRP